MSLSQPWLLSVCAALRSCEKVRLASCMFRVVQRFGLDGCPKRDMLTSQGLGCFCFSAELAVLLTLHLVDHLVEPEFEGHVSFSGVAM